MCTSYKYMLKEGAQGSLPECSSKAWKQTLSPVFLGSPKEVKSGLTRLVTLKNHSQGIKS